MVYKKLTYDVVAYRYGDTENGYVVAEVCDEITAKKLAEYEQELRGGKYTVHIRKILE